MKRTKRSWTVAVVMAGAWDSMALASGGVVLAESSSTVFLGTQINLNETPDPAMEGDDGEDSPSTASDGGAVFPPMGAAATSLAAFPEWKTRSPSGEARAPSGETRKKTSTAIDDSAVPLEALVGSRAHFRAVFQDEWNAQAADPRFVGSLAAGAAADVWETAQPQADDMDDAIEEPKAKLDASQTYGFADGKLVQLQVDAQIPLAGAAPPSEAAPSFGLVAEKSASPSSAPLATSTSASAPTTPLTAASAPSSESTPSPAPRSHALERALVHGRVIVPDGFNPQDVVLRVAGTQLQVVADENGGFSVFGLPVGSRFELIVWDLDGELARRVLPVSVGRNSAPVEVALERAKDVEQVARAFGHPQDRMRSGFCGELTGLTPTELAGATVILSDPHADGPFFFNERGLPDASLKDASSDGRLCAFNVADELLEVEVTTLGNLRRRFVLATKSTTFDARARLEMREATYRPVAARELRDMQEVMNRADPAAPLAFASAVMNRWIFGDDAPLWAKVDSLSLRAERAYAPVPLRPGQEEDLRYLPLGQELQEIAFDAGAEGAHAGFQLFPSGGVATGSHLQEKHLGEQRGAVSTVSTDPTSPLLLSTLSQANIDDLERLIAGASGDEATGSAFLSVTPPALGLEYGDVRLSLRNVMTNDRVGDFRFLEPAKGQKRPNFLRGIFTGLPRGQYTLVVTNAAGEVMWLDLIRSYPRRFQVLDIAP